MKCTGIIAEYNPFHNGHAYHIKKARELTGARFIVAVMSGSFVQRGDVAVCDKFTRAQQALLGGADIVIELPAPFTLANAEIFARGAVSMLSATGLVDSLCFGSTCQDTALLKEAAQKLYTESDEFKQALSFYLSGGSSYPCAISKALGPQMSALFSDANDILAVEYIKAIMYTGAPVTPYAVKREGPLHDTLGEENGLSSASALRRAISEDDRDMIRRCTPDYAHAPLFAGMDARIIPQESRMLSQALLYKLRSMSISDIAALPDISEGLENVIHRAALSATDYDSLLAAIKTKRYTMARIKRILMCALIGIRPEHRELSRQYIRVLGVRKDSLTLLSMLAQSAKLPVITRFSERERLSNQALEVCDLSIFAHRLSCMASPVPQSPQSDYTSPLIMV